LVVSHTKVIQTSCDRRTEKRDRHLQAAKATLVEFTKAAYEKSLIAKALITYIDQLSEKPNHGV